MKAAYVLNPGESFPAEASSTLASLTSGPTSSSSASASSVPSAIATPSDSSEDEEDGSGGLSTGAIVGIAIGGAALLLLAAALFFFVGRNRTLREVLQRQSIPPQTSPVVPAEMYHHPSGGVFVPVKPNVDYRTSAMSGPYDVPPYPQSPGMSVDEVASLRATSPRAPFTEFGGAHGTDA